MSNSLEFERQCDKHQHTSKASFLKWLLESLAAILGVSLFMALPLWTGYRLYMAKCTEAWPTTQGTVIDASFKERLRGDPDQPSYTEFIPVVSYNYTINNKTYTSNRLAYNDLTTDNQVNLREFLGSYSSGTTVKVFYSPKDHSCSVLIPGIPGSDEYFREVTGFIGLIAVCIVIFGLIWIYSIWNRVLDKRLLRPIGNGR